MTEETQLMSWWHKKDMINGVGGVGKAKEKPDQSIDESDHSRDIHSAALPWSFGRKVRAV